MLSAVHDSDSHRCYRFVCWLCNMYDAHDLRKQQQEFNSGGCGTQIIATPTGPVRRDQAEHLHRGPCPSIRSSGCGFRIQAVDLKMWQEVPRILAGGSLTTPSVSCRLSSISTAAQAGGQQSHSRPQPLSS